MQWLFINEVADLLNVSKQAVHFNVHNGKYGSKIRQVPGKGRGGKQIQIALEALPSEAQFEYFKNKAETEFKEAGGLSGRDPLDCYNDKQKRVISLKLKALDGYKFFEAERLKEGKCSKVQLKHDFIDNWNRENPDMQPD